MRIAEFEGGVPFEAMMRISIQLVSWKGTSGF